MDLSSTAALEPFASAEEVMEAVELELQPRGYDTDMTRGDLAIIAPRWRPERATGWW